MGDASCKGQVAGWVHSKNNGLDDFSVEKGICLFTLASENWNVQPATLRMGWSLTMGDGSCKGQVAGWVHSKNNGLDDF
jgi:hypothetical protein